MDTVLPKANVPSVTKAIQILDTLAADKNALTLVELTQALGLAEKYGAVHLFDIITGGDAESPGQWKLLSRHSSIGSRAFSDQFASYPAALK